MGESPDLCAERDRGPLVFRWAPMKNGNEHHALSFPLILPLRSCRKSSRREHRPAAAGNHGTLPPDRRNPAKKATCGDLQQNALPLRARQPSFAAQMASVSRRVCSTSPAHGEIVATEESYESAWHGAAPATAVTRGTLMIGPIPDRPRPAPVGSLLGRTPLLILPGRRDLYHRTCHHRLCRRPQARGIDMSDSAHRRLTPATNGRG